MTACAYITKDAISFTHIVDMLFYKKSIEISDVESESAIGITDGLVKGSSMLQGAGYRELHQNVVVV